MEVTKQKMRCAAAEDPSYPCKHHEEGQVSQLPGKEVTAACRGASPYIATGADPGWSQMQGSPGQVRGADGGTPWAAANRGTARVWPVSRAVRVAGPPLAITMSLCAGTAVPNGAEKQPPLGTRGERGEGALGGAHGSTQLHVCMHPYMYPTHVPWVGTHSLSATNTGVHTLVSPAFVAPRDPHPPQGPPQALRELPRRGFLLPGEISPGQTRRWGSALSCSANTEGRGAAHQDLAHW